MTDNQGITDNSAIVQLEATADGVLDNSQDSTLQSSQDSTLQSSQDSALDNSLTEEQASKLELAQKIVGYDFKDKKYILSAITHPSAIEGKPVKFSYERLEFLGDSILGAIVSSEAFHRFPDLNEGGLTRIKVALVSGSSLASIAEKLGFKAIIVFGLSETGTGNRGLHSALENVYEAIVAALYLDGGIEAAADFVNRTLIPKMSIELAKEPENPKSALQEKLQEDGITPTYKLVETQGPPHDRTFISQVYAGDHALAQGSGRTKKEAESQAAKSTLAHLAEFFGLGMDEETKAAKNAENARMRAEKQEAKAKARAERDEANRKAREIKAQQKDARKKNTWIGRED